MTHGAPLHRQSTDLVIAVLARSDQLGGAERSTIELAADDQERGGRWLIVARDTGPGAVGDLTAELGVPLLTAKSALHAFWLLRRARPAAVWAFGLRWSFTLRWFHALGVVRGESGRRSLLFVAQRGLDTWRQAWHNHLDRATQSMVDAYVANSAAAADMLVNQVGIKRRSVFVVHTGISQEWLTTPRRERLTPDDVARIIVVGNNRVEKAFEDIVEILRRLGPDGWAVTIFTNEAGALPDLICRAGLRSKATVVVRHCLSIDDYDRADILLHAAHAESFPRVVLEATARHLAVVASDVGDVRLVVPRSGLFRAGDVNGALAVLEAALKSRRHIRPHSAEQSPLRPHLAVADDIRALVGSLS